MYGAYPTSGVAAGVLLEPHGQAFLKKSGPAFATPGEVGLPQIQTQNPKIWVIMTNHPVNSGNSAQVPCINVILLLYTSTSY